MINYKLIEERLNDALSKETKESLLEWLKKHESDNFDWMKNARKFYVEKRIICKALRDVEIVAKRQRDDSIKWAVVCDGNYSMNKVDGHFDFEPSPSERDGDYLEDHRFDSKEEALKEYRRLINEDTLCIIQRLE